MSTKSLLAFYGATGGCTLACLTPALNAGYDCTALARTPSKLTSALLAKGVSQSAIDEHLHITQGDVLDVSAVRGPLTLDGRGADIIFSGIGITTFAQSRVEVTICAQGVTNILAALREANLPKKPMLVSISSTGITRGEETRDLPLLMVPLYRLGLKNPHADKIHMEEVVEAEMAKGEGSVIRGFVLPRPSFLTDGKIKGVKDVRAGTEKSPAVGYTISRGDVGGWMFEELVVGGGEKYLGKKVTLTY